MHKFEAHTLISENLSLTGYSQFLPVEIEKSLCIYTCTWVYMCIYILTYIYVHTYIYQNGRLTKIVSVFIVHSNKWPVKWWQIL